MGLYNDILDPAAATEVARRALALEESKKSSLAGFLPNVMVDTPTVEISVEPLAARRPAQFRAFDAEPAFGRAVSTQEKIVRLTPVSEQEPVGEYQQLLAGIGDDSDKRVRPVVRAIQRVVGSVFEAAEVARAGVLTTGRLTINQPGFQIDESFGRSANQTVTAPTLWNAVGVDILQQIADFVEVYESNNGGVSPETLLLPKRVLSFITKNTAFATNVANGVTRPAGLADVNNILAGQSLPTIEVYDRANALGRLIPDDTILLLPARGETSAPEMTELGGTAWGPTLVGQSLDWDLAADDQVGIVAGVFRNEKPPAGLEVIADALMLPILKNANLSFAAKVL